jgi:large subunit ribosomal protein L25
MLNGRKDKQRMASKQVTLNVERRSVLGKQVKHLRRDGILPANIYGHLQESQAVQVDTHEMERALKAHGATTLYRLVIAPEGSEETVMVRHITRQPATNIIQHIDFFHVQMSEPMRAKVPVRLVGEAPAVKLHDGVLIQLLDYAEIEALPAELPEALELDISDMTDLNTSRYASAIKIPGKVTLITPEDEVIISIQAPRVVAEEAPAAAEGQPAATPAADAATEE